MAMTIIGGQFFVSTTLAATYDQAGMEALTWTEIKGLTSLPSIPQEAGIITTTEIDKGYEEAYIGGTTFGESEVPANYIEGDSGQAIALAATDPADSSYGDDMDFKLLYNNGAVRYFRGKFTAASETGGDSEALVTLPMTIKRTKPVIRVAAA